MLSKSVSNAIARKAARTTPLLSLSSFGDSLIISREQRSMLQWIWCYIRWKRETFSSDHSCCMLWNLRWYRRLPIPLRVTVTFLHCEFPPPLSKKPFTRECLSKILRTNQWFCDQLYVPSFIHSLQHATPILSRLYVQFSWRVRVKCSHGFIDLFFIMLSFSYVILFCYDILFIYQTLI